MGSRLAATRAAALALAIGAVASPCSAVADTAASPTVPPSVERSLAGLRQHVQALRDRGTPAPPPASVQSQAQAVRAPKPPTPVLAPAAPVDASGAACEQHIEKVEEEVGGLKQRAQNAERILVQQDEAVDTLSKQFFSEGFRCPGEFVKSVKVRITEAQSLEVRGDESAAERLNVCVQTRRRSIAEQIARATAEGRAVRSVRLNNEQDRITVLQSETTDLWQDFGNFASKRDRLIRQLEEMRDECEA